MTPVTNSAKLADPHYGVHAHPTSLILVVDDDRTMRMILVEMLTRLGYSCLEAANGQQALEVIQTEYENIDAILLDREMPVMNGMQVVAAMKADRKLRNIPIIMQTGYDQPSQVKEGIDAGVFYYLTKPINEDILKSVLAASVREMSQTRLLFSELKHQKTSFNLIDTCVFRFCTLPEAEHLASFIANCFPEPERSIMGIAELLINAVEHGIYEIGYEQKSLLIHKGAWREELLKRAEHPAFKDRKAEAILKRSADGIFLTIKDYGKGFDWRAFMQIDPARASDNHGRGIAQANSVCFDELGYNDKGNEVTAFVGNSAQLEW